MLTPVSTPPSAHTSPAWQTLTGMAEHYLHSFDLRTAFAGDPQRLDRFSLRTPHLLADLSKDLGDERVFEQLLALAESQATCCPSHGHAQGLAMPQDIGGRFSLWSAVGLPDVWRPDGSEATAWSSGL